MIRFSHLIWLWASPLALAVIDCITALDLNDTQFEEAVTDSFLGLGARACRVQLSPFICPDAGGIGVLEISVDAAQTWQSLACVTNASLRENVTTLINKGLCCDECETSQVCLAAGGMCSDTCGECGVKDQRYGGCGNCSGLCCAPCQLDINPRVAFLCGMVNQHFDLDSRVWLSDFDGVSGCLSPDMDNRAIVTENALRYTLEYCKKWYPLTSAVDYYQDERLRFLGMGNEGLSPPVYVLSMRCVQPIPPSLAPSSSPSSSPSVIVIPNDFLSSFKWNQRAYILAGNTFFGLGVLSCVAAGSVASATHLIHSLQYTSLLTFLGENDDGFVAFGSRFAPFSGLIPWFPRLTPSTGGRRRLLEEATSGHEGVDKLANVLNIAVEEMHSVILVSLVVFGCCYFLFSLLRARCHKLRVEQYYQYVHEVFNMSYGTVWLFACLAQRNSMAWMVIGSSTQLFCVAILWYLRKRVLSVGPSQGYAVNQFLPYHADLRHDMRQFFLVVLGCQAVDMVALIGLPLSHGIRLAVILCICVTETLVTLTYRPFKTPLLNGLKATTLTIRLFQLCTMFLLPGDEPAVVLIVLNVLGQVVVAVGLIFPKVWQFYQRWQARKKSGYQLQEQALDVNEQD